MILKDKQGKEIVDKNFFNAMSYELAGEIGILDNEDMKQNIKLISDKNKLIIGIILIIWFVFSITDFSLAKANKTPIFATGE